MLMLSSAGLHFNNFAEEFTPSGLLIGSYSACRDMEGARSVVLIVQSKDMEAEIQLCGVGDVAIHVGQLGAVLESPDAHGGETGGDAYLCESRAALKSGWTYLSDCTGNFHTRQAGAVLKRMVADFRHGVRDAHASEF